MQLATLRGWLVYHVRRSDAGIVTARGFPDLVLLRERALWVELKTERGKLTPAQVIWRDRLQAAGQDWRLWRPSSWAEIESALA